MHPESAGTKTTGLENIPGAQTTQRALQFHSLLERLTCQLFNVQQAIIQILAENQLKHTTGIKSLFNAGTLQQSFCLHSKP